MEGIGGVCTLLCLGVDGTDRFWVSFLRDASIICGEIRDRSRRPRRPEDVFAFGDAEHGFDLRAAEGVGRQRLRWVEMPGGFPLSRM